MQAISNKHTSITLVTIWLGVIEPSLNDRLSQTKADDEMRGSPLLLVNAGSNDGEPHINGLRLMSNVECFGFPAGPGVLIYMATYGCMGHFVYAGEE